MKNSAALTTHGAYTTNWSGSSCCHRAGKLVWLNDVKQLVTLKLDPCILPLASSRIAAYHHSSNDASHDSKIYSHVNNELNRYHPEMAIIMPIYMWDLKRQVLSLDISPIWDTVSVYTIIIFVPFCGITSIHHCGADQWRLLKRSYVLILKSLKSWAWIKALYMSTENILLPSHFVSNL